MVYENNVLKMLQHTEGRVLPDGANWEYQYFLKDHLGNVRITFTAKTQTATNYTTDFEAATNPNFQNYNNTTFDLVDHTDAAGTVYQKVQWLNGGVNGRVGLAKSLPVMPGDQVSITAYTKYMNLGTTGNANPLITSLAAAFGVSAGSTGEALKIYNGLNSYAATVPAGDHYQDNESAPKAFVTILFFDKDYNFIDAAWDQVTTTGAQTSPTVKQPPHDVMSITAKAPEAGYAFVFLSNEHFYYVDVYFDDATVSHTPSPIVSVSDYFPFGLSYNTGERAGGLEQKYLYNSKELQDEMALNWYDYGARMYMPEIGRWGVIDPLADMARRWTPYRYAFNNPLRFIDPDGMFEYSDGYSKQDSRNATGAMSHSGAFEGGMGDIKQGSSASNKVIATAESGQSVEVETDGTNLGVIGAGESDSDAAQQNPYKDVNDKFGGSFWAEYQGYLDAHTPRSGFDDAELTRHTKINVERRKDRRLTDASGNQLEPIYYEIMLGNPANATPQNPNGIDFKTREYIPIKDWFKSPVERQYGNPGTISDNGDPTPMAYPLDSGNVLLLIITFQKIPATN